MGGGVAAVLHLIGLQRPSLADVVADDREGRHRRVEVMGERAAELLGHVGTSSSS
jgi:hypothetical protein